MWCTHCPMPSISFAIKFTSGKQSLRHKGFLMSCPLWVSTTSQSQIQLSWPPVVLPHRGSFSSLYFGNIFSEHFRDSQWQVFSRFWPSPDCHLTVTWPLPDHLTIICPLPDLHLTTWLWPSSAPYLTLTLPCLWLGDSAQKKLSGCGWVDPPNIYYPFIKDLSEIYKLPTSWVERWPWSWQ